MFLYTEIPTTLYKSQACPFASIYKHMKDKLVSESQVRLYSKEQLALSICVDLISGTKNNIWLCRCK